MPRIVSGGSGVVGADQAGAPSGEDDLGLPFHAGNAGDIAPMRLGEVFQANVDIGHADLPCWFRAIASASHVRRLSSKRRMPNSAFSILERQKAFGQNGSALSCQGEWKRQ
ncbi:hypothetical protein [Labrys neptuniae]